MSGKDLRAAKWRDFKIRVLKLVCTNPNEQSHFSSQCELMMEKKNDQDEDLQSDSRTAENFSSDFAAVYSNAQERRVVAIHKAPRML